MLGNILIDKFKCYIPVNNEDNVLIDNCLKHIRNVLSKHFAENAYSVYLTKNKFKVVFVFTPTRYFSNAKTSEATDTNIDMPDENEIESLFNELTADVLFLKNIQKIKITKLHLAKNIIPDKLNKKYLDALKERIYPYPYKVLTHGSKQSLDTVVITSLAYNSENADNTGDREIIFYNKDVELTNKNVVEIKLKKPLTPKEISMLSKDTYNEVSHTLFINYLQIQRCEMQYENSVKLQEISEFLGFKHLSKGLYLSDFLNLLKENVLYENLNAFYKRKLKCLLCKDNETSKNLNIYQKILKDYWDETLNLPLKNIFKETGLETSYNQSLLKIQNYINNPLFAELSEKFIGT